MPCVIEPLIGQPVGRNIVPSGSQDGRGAAVNKQIDGPFLFEFKGTRMGLRWRLSVWLVLHEYTGR
jgi:hypothetical protein